MMPSRQFMIQQAVLNAIPKYDERVWQILGTNLTLSAYCSGEWVRTSFCDVVREEYRTLATREQLIESGRTCQN